MKSVILEIDSKLVKIDEENIIEMNGDCPTQPTQISSGYFELKEPINEHITWGTESLHLAKN